MDIKIRGASKEQWPIVADMVRANLGIIDRCGETRGAILTRDGMKIYLYVTRSGKSAVAMVDAI